MDGLTAPVEKEREDVFARAPRYCEDCAMEIPAGCIADVVTTWVAIGGRQVLLDVRHARPSVCLRALGEEVRFLSEQVERLTSHP